MPKMEGGNRIVFDEADWLSGLAPNYTTGLTDTPAVLSGNQLAAASSFNPYRFPRYAAPGFNPTDVDNITSINTIILNGIVAYESSTGYAYMISQGSRLHQMTLSTSTISIGGAPWPHIIPGTGITGSDVISYRVGANNRIFYSYQDAGVGYNIGMYNLDGATFNDTFMSTTPATVGTISYTNEISPIPMIVGADDVMYWASGNVINAFDGQVGANGTTYASVLTLPVGYNVTAFARLPNFLVAFAYQQLAPTITGSFWRSTSQAFAWDYLSIDPTYIYELEDNQVSEAVEFKGTVGCFTQGRLPINDGANRFGKFKMFNGSRFETVETFIGNAPVHGGADVIGDMVQWNSDGLLHSYGSPFEGLPIVLNKTARGTSAGSSSNGGMVKTFDNRGTYISTGSSTGDGLLRLATNTYATGSVATSIADPGFPWGKIGRAKSLTLYFGKTSSGGRDLTINLVDSSTGAETIVASVSGITASTMSQKIEFQTNGNELLSFQDLKLVAQWGAGGGATDAPIIRRAVVEYETTNITN